MAVKAYGLSPGQRLRQEGAICRKKRPFLLCWDHRCDFMSSDVSTLADQCTVGHFELAYSTADSKSMDVGQFPNLGFSCSSSSDQPEDRTTSLAFPHMYSTLADPSGQQNCNFSNDFFMFLEILCLDHLFSVSIRHHFLPSARVSLNSRLRTVLNGG
jgi:hypothetical protein